MKFNNPYADRDGGPKRGHLPEWHQWIHQAEAERRSALTPDQRQAEDLARRPLQRRMQAESDFR